MYRISNPLILSFTMKQTVFILAVLLHAGIGLSRAQAQTLTLEVRDIEHPGGYLYVALYNSEDNFLKEPVATFRVEAAGQTVSVPCTGLPAGDYALSLFHDLNGNGRLDTERFGIPTEPYAFSNDAEGIMGPPSYKKCSFLFDTTLVVHLK